MADFKLTVDQYALLAAVVENAINDNRAVLSQAKTQHNNLPHYRVAAAQLAFDQAEQALVLIQQWKPAK